MKKRCEHYKQKCKCCSPMLLNTHSELGENTIAKLTDLIKAVSQCCSLDCERCADNIAEIEKRLKEGCPNCGW